MFARRDVASLKTAVRDIAPRWECQMRCVGLVGAGSRDMGGAVSIFRDGEGVFLGDCGEGREGVIAFSGRLENLEVDARVSW